MPERDILSLCVMGWRLDKFGTSSAVAVVVVAPLPAPNLKNQKSSYFLQTFDIFCVYIAKKQTNILKT